MLTLSLRALRRELEAAKLDAAHERGRAEFAEQTCADLRRQVERLTELLEQVASRPTPGGGLIPELEKEAPPVEGALPVSGLSRRLDEVWGPGGPPPESTVWLGRLEPTTAVTEPHGA